MNIDLTKLLEAWPYESGKINVRLINGDDETPKIQIRLDLGILQMNIDGRPDGKRPGGYPSLLDYYEAKLDAINRGDYPLQEEHAPFDESPHSDEPADSQSQAEQACGDSSAHHAPASPEHKPLEIEPDTPDDEAPYPDDAPSAGEESFVLTPQDCRLLREEAVQYYHRYVALLVLEDFDRVVRDTTRNLRLLDFCAQYAREEEDRTMLEQFRPYIMMMRARALASQALRDEEPKAALLAIDEGLEMLRQFFLTHNKLELFESSNEAQMLREMRDSLIPKLPVSQKAELKERLRQAIAQENYELASILRDELRMLHD